MDKELEPCPFCGSCALNMGGYDFHKICCSNEDCGIYGVAFTQEGWKKRHFPEGCTPVDARHLREANFDLATERQELSDLLHECYMRFKSYQMDVDMSPPDHHRDFMKRVETALAV